MDRDGLQTGPPPPPLLAGAARSLVPHKDEGAEDLRPAQSRQRALGAAAKRHAPLLAALAQDDEPALVVCPDAVITVYRFKVDA